MCERSPSKTTNIISLSFVPHSLHVFVDAKSGTSCKIHWGSLDSKRIDFLVLAGAEISHCNVRFNFSCSGIMHSQYIRHIHVHILRALPLRLNSLIDNSNGEARAHPILSLGWSHSLLYPPTPTLALIVSSALRLVYILDLPELGLKRC